LLGYYTDDGRLIYAGRVGTGMSDKVLGDLRRKLEPLSRAAMPLKAPPPRKTRFGSPLVLRACIGWSRSSSLKSPTDLD
jgi:ATP-dependent DNA ligase